MELVRSTCTWFLPFLCCLFVVIRIGFARNVYTYYEPDFETSITNVTLIKEANQLTEQLYSVGVTLSSPTAVGANPATLESIITELGDYTIFGGAGVRFRMLPFFPDQQGISFVFTLLNDELAEGTEAFQATISTVEGTPTFRDPIIASRTTTIRILDNDCKLKILK